MSMQRMVVGTGRVALGLGMALACLGLTGCGGDDDDADASASTVVVTNVVDGTTVTTVVVETNAPAAEGASILDVKGAWGGNFQTSHGQGHLELDLSQTGVVVAGAFAVNTGGADSVGTLNGRVDGDSLDLTLVITGSAVWIRLAGNVNAASTEFRGTFSSSTYGLGQFVLRR